MTPLLSSQDLRGMAGQLGAGLGTLQEGSCSADPGSCVHASGCNLLMRSTCRYTTQHQKTKIHTHRGTKCSRDTSSSSSRDKVPLFRVSAEVLKDLKHRSESRFRAGHRREFRGNTGYAIYDPKSPA